MYTAFIDSKNSYLNLRFALWRFFFVCKNTKSESIFEVALY